MLSAMFNAYWRFGSVIKQGEIFISVYFLYRFYVLCLMHFISCSRNFYVVKWIAIWFKTSDWIYMWMPTVSLEGNCWSRHLKEFRIEHSYIRKKRNRQIYMCMCVCVYTLYVRWIRECMRLFVCLYVCLYVKLYVYACLPLCARVHHLMCINFWIYPS